MRITLAVIALPDECQQVQAICNRISQVYSSGLEESVQRFRNSWGS
ncbi:MAG: hypothetical protein RMY28_031080 [Nostoc sp. ChiSLP01]